ncbi:MAG: DEAD/DEAH box helicase [Isosphaeraceae bacterium]|nr:DEAD/DEAH box helicase [Isosphaeraceae bacterium]
MHPTSLDAPAALATLAGPVRDWFARAFPDGPTPAQARAWPAIAAGENLLLISPTGTGKTLAAFLAILDRLYREHADGTLGPGLRCVYVSPLRSLGYDIERNLAEPLEAIRRALGLGESPVSVGVRTGDTPARERRRLRDAPPHLLITTPESLALLLSQTAWDRAWAMVEHVIVDEVHALVPTKRGADLAVSLERLSAKAAGNPCRIGLSATCRPAEAVARFLVGPARACRIIEAERPEGTGGPVLEVESLLRPDEGPHRGLTYRRLLRRLNEAIGENRTTVIFANTRAFAEKITHDLRPSLGAEAIAAHHSALDAHRRREVEAALKAGDLRAVVTSTSLELGVDIGSADLAVMVGLPGSAARCLQRVGRAGHRPGQTTRGLLLAATAAELAGAAVTAQAAREGRVEPLRPIRNPLDVLCQQLLGMACGGEWSAEEAYDLVRRTEPFSDLSRDDFDACLAYLAGELAAPAGAYEPEPGAEPRWTSPRLWKKRGDFGIRSRRVLRLFWSNVGTITSEESVRVLVDGVELGTLEAAYAERLQAGDRFVLDGRALEFRRLERLVVHARATEGEPDLPRWSSDRQSLSAELARDLARFREEAAAMLADGLSALRAWLVEAYELPPDAADRLGDLFAAQEQVSEVPRAGMLLVEESPHPEGFTYTFHAPLARSACEALGRAVAARLGQRFSRNLALTVADLGWSIRLSDGARIGPEDLPELLATEGLAADVMEGLDRGDLLARRFRHVAGTGLMVLRNPEGGRPKVGGLLWVSRRLYPLVKAACPDHPLLRETRREVLDDLLDTPGALAWLARRPALRFRTLDGPSPFAAAWIDAGGPEPLRYETPAEALRRLHARLTGG